jgi:hypothetical protein
MRELTVILFCTWKFAATFPVAIYVMRMSFTETLIYTNIGGIIGVAFFFYFSDFLIRMWNRYWPESLTFKRRKRKIFTPWNRRFVRIKNNYGLSGIVILSPVLLSIPVGSFLAAKYYGTKPNVIFRLIAGQILWSVAYTLFYTQIKTILV